ncbi:MAG: response regulator [Lachnospiraceae bacterium]|nr:response regulator [Lachnospiraceae bacterium]
MDSGKNSKIAGIVLAGSVAVLIILVAGTLWMGRNAARDTQDAVRTVSLLYLDELAGRREQVVEGNLKSKIRDLQTAVELMEENDLSDKAHLEAYQSRMKRLYSLDKFAFVDEDGLIYTSQGTQDNIGDYDFDYRTIEGPEISILNVKSEDRKVVIAVPVSLAFGGKTLSVAFMEIDMQEMLAGVSMTSENEGSTFCNIYTTSGVALSNTVLGGLAVEDNLLQAMERAEYDRGYTYDAFLLDFVEGRAGETSFVYNGIHETLSFVPVTGTNWRLTYLIRESVISDEISAISDGIIIRSIVQSILTVLALLIMFGYIIAQSRRNARLRLERETSEAENRVKQAEMEHRLALQEKLLEEERRRTQQSEMISALAADYWSVYYLELDRDEGVCYQAHSDITDGFRVGERFRYLESVTAYAKRYIKEEYLDEFLRFIQPEAIREGLKENRVISYTYVVSRGGKESYESVRFAKVRNPEEADDGAVRSVGACFVNADIETRKTMAQNQALNDALAAAEQASRAKTAFLSSMSHEIRTPMNAIIGLDNIALSDKELPEKTRGYLEKIGTSAEHLLNLINDILDMSRIESGRMTIKNEEFSFRRLLEAVNTMFSGQCRDKGLTYSCHIFGEIDDYYIGDNMKLRQVLINILGNAVKFTPVGGKVELQVERKNSFEGRSVLCFRISDTGIGMSPEFLPHIFDTFTQEDASSTSRYGSSGLGMAITKNIVEMMNGSIEVESEKGKGTVFTVTVTLADSSKRDADSESDEIRPEQMTVLIVDDDPVACEHARLVLEKAGIGSETAGSGPEAVEKVRLRHARREPYNLILVDWQMPDMDGVETTRRMRSIIGNESAIIILTAYRWDDILEEALEAGVDSFIAKPLFAAAVLEEFKSALRRKSSSAEQKPCRAELEGRRILMAEDMQINAEIMMMVLQSRGMETDLAENGRICVEKFAEHEPGYYDAVLMDMRMPEMDGLEATKMIRSMDRQDAKEIPIIALTANAFDEDVQRSLQAGLNAHLSKPVQPEALFETLESLIPAQR